MVTYGDTVKKLTHGDMRRMVIAMEQIYSGARQLKKWQQRQNKPTTAQHATTQKPMIAMAMATP